MLGDLRVLDLDDELLLDVRARGAAGALRPDAPLQARLRRRAAQAHGGARAAVARRPRRARGGRRRGRPAAEHARAPAGRLAGHPVRLVATDVGVDVLCDADAHRGRARRAARRRRVRVTEAAAEVVRVERGRPALRRRPRRGDDPPGGRPQRPRGELHQGLLRRPGDRRAAVLPRQAQPPPARPEALGGAAGRRRLRLGEREVGTLASSLVSPVHGPIGLALVRREAEPGATLDVAGGATAEVVELPFAAAADERLRTAGAGSGSSARARVSWPASHVCTMRASATSVAGRWAVVCARRATARRVRS